MNLNKLRDEAYKNAVAHGWHEQEYPNQHWMMLVISELSEAIQADRSGKRANKELYLSEVDALTECTSEEIRPSISRYYFHEIISNTLEDELADVIIRILDFAGLRNIDLETIEFPSDAKDYNKELLKILNLPLPQIFFIITMHLTSEDFEPDDLQCTIFLIKEYARLTLNIDIDWFIKMKMEYNKHRRYKHGKKY